MPEFDYNEPSLYAPDLLPFPDMTGRVVIISPTVYDTKALCTAFGFEDEKPKTIFCTHTYMHAPKYPYLALCSEFMGAPTAVAVLEVLAGKGAKGFLFYGPCGSLDPAMDVGTIFLAENALSEEGTSRHYSPELWFEPDAEYARILKAILNMREQRFAHGAMVSTDGLFRETLSKINYYRSQGCHGIDMETSALFAVAQYLRVKLCSVNVISDVFCDDVWLNGFSSGEFKKGRLEAIEIMKEMVAWMHKNMTA